MCTLLFSCKSDKQYHKTVTHKEKVTSSTLLKDIYEFQDKTNAEFKNATTSPLLEKDRKDFVSLPFFDPDTSYVVKAKFISTPNELPFFMPTTTGRTPEYKKYGEVHFKLKGETFKLNVYQNQELLLSEEYKDYLFLPFTDKTNGNETYAGGRYINLSIPVSDSITLDFNKAYNPYCVYNPKYSCPIVPSENYLPIAVKAGMKAWNK